MLFWYCSAFFLPSSVAWFSLFSLVVRKAMVASSRWLLPTSASFNFAACVSSLFCCCSSTLFSAIVLASADLPASSFSFWEISVAISLTVSLAPARCCSSSLNCSLISFSIFFWASLKLSTSPATAASIFWYLADVKARCSKSSARAFVPLFLLSNKLNDPFSFSATEVPFVSICSNRSRMNWVCFNRACWSAYSLNLSNSMMP